MAGKITRGSPAHVSLARTLGIEIATERYPVGSLLPNEIELASQHKLSRSVIREALRMLAAKGLIDSRRKAGTRVRDRADWNVLDPELLGWMFEGAPPIDFVRDLFDLRLIVEPAAAARAAERRNASDLSRMGHLLETMAEKGLATEAGQTADQQFHAALLHATGNQLLAGLAASITAAVRWTTLFKYRSSRRPHDPIPQHRVLFEAIANGDPAAAHAAATKLIEQARRDTESSLAS